MASTRAATNGGELLLRRSDGSLRATIARQIYTYSYDRGDGSLYFLARGTLVRAHGATERQLATLSSLGLTPRGSLQLEPLGGLIALQNAHRLVVLRPNGSLFTAVPLPPRKASGDGVSSTPKAAPDRSAIAFTATRGHEPGGGSPGTEAVYLVRAGAARGRAIHSERVDFAVCERGSTLAWHGRWLLYSTSEGNLSLVDTSHPHHAINLAQTLRRLPGTNGDQGHLDFNAYWTGDPSGL